MRQGQTILPNPPDTAPPQRDGEVRESVVDLQSYPVLTEEVPAGGPLRPSGTSVGPQGATPIGQVAQNAVSEVLGWRCKTTDPKAFVSALTQSFALKQVEGHVEFTLMPRSYTVQTDLGAVTGAQASIYTRAKVALDQASPLLDGLYPLLPEVLPEDLESIRSVVRSEFTALVNEFGVEGGPRVQRVNQFFLLLLGLNPGVVPPPVPPSPENIHGDLGRLGSRFGLSRSFVTTIDDEQNLTNYLILIDYVTGLYQSWITQQAFFTRNGDGGVEPFFGTQLVLLSRSLDVVSQSVKDVYFAMDSVFLGPAERQTISLSYPGQSSLFVAELLDWADTASSKELPQILQDSGKDGIPSVISVLNTVIPLVDGAIIPKQPPKGLPPGYRTPRVQRSLRELSDALNEALKLAQQIKPPNFPSPNGSVNGSVFGFAGGH
jgi:hypothetical protein